MRKLSQGLRFARRLLLFSTVVLSAGLAQAQERITVPTLDFVRAAIAKQQYDLARQVLEILLRRQPNSVELNFLLAQVDGSDGKLPEAIERYRAILTDHPELVRVRLDLARALFLQKDDETAEYHFRLALASPDITPDVIKNVQTFLDAIRARRNWQFSVVASLAPNTNINTGPASSTVNIAGLPFTLSNTTKQQSGIGAVFTVSGEYDFKLDDTTKLRSGGYIYRAEYPGKAFDDLMIGVYGGPQWVRQDYDVSVLGVLDRRWFANDPYNVAFGPRAQFNWNLSPRLRLESQVEFMKRKYRTTTTFLNGFLVDANAALAYAITPTSFGRVILGAGYEHTTADYFTNTYWRVGVGYKQELPWGISIEDQPEVYHYHYDGQFPLFERTRRDWLLRNTLTFYKRDWHLWGFSPTFNYIFSHDISNIPLFKYTQHQFQVGATKQF
jgi:outer membrane protein